MYVKVTKYDQFSSQSVAILQKIRKLGKKDSVSELVFPTRRGSVKAEEVNMMGGSELKLHEFMPQDDRCFQKCMQLTLVS